MNRVMTSASSPSPRPLHSRVGRAQTTVLLLVVALVLIAASITTCVLVLATAGQDLQVASAAVGRDTRGRTIITSSSGAVEALPAEDPNGALAVALAGGIDEFFRKLAAAMRAGDETAFAECFDLDRLCAQVEQLGVLPPMSATDRSSFVRGLRLGVGRTVHQYQSGLVWDAHEVKRIEQLDGGEEAIAYVRAASAASKSIKSRWWLTKQSGSWRAYDMEDLDLGLRTSSSLAIAAAGALTGPDGWLTQVRRLNEAPALLLRGRADDARVLLEQLAAADLPAPFESMRLMLLATAHSAREQYELAAAAIEDAAALNDDMPILDYLRAVVFNGLGRHTDALVAARRYGSLVGTDAEVLLEMGEAQRALGRSGLAAGAYRASLDLDPGCLDCLYGLWLLPDETNAAELAQRLAAVPDPVLGFESLAIVFLDDGRPSLVEALAAAYRPLRPDDPNLGYYLARACYDQERYEEAERLLRAALPRAPLDEHDAYEEFLLETLIAQGGSLRAYREADDPSFAFRYIADSLVFAADIDALRELVDVHEQAHPNDLWYQYYQGEVRTLEGAHHSAAEAFAAGATSPDPELRSACRYRLITSLYLSGELVDAYRTVGPRRETARQLYDHCRSRDDLEGLVALLEVHRASDPEDPALPLWDADVAWLHYDYESVVRQLRRHADELAADPELIGLYEDRLVRALTRLGRLSEALAAARTSTGRDGDPYYEVLVQAAAGRTDAASAALEHCLALGYVPDVFYDDPDAGPALAGPAFAALRREHPPVRTR